MLTLDLELEAGSLTDKPATQYKNFDFNSYAVLPDGTVFAADRSGLYELGGTTDNGSAIAWELSTPAMTFGHNGFKRMRFGYLQGNFYGTITVKTHVDTAAFSKTYTVLYGKSSGLQQTRFPFGRDEQGAYWRFTLSGVTDFSLDSFAVLPVMRTRGITGYA